MTGSRPRGVLRAGWQAQVDDYAIAGDWSLRGAQLLVADAAGGVHSFEGTSGARQWSRPRAHVGSVLAAEMDATGTTFATAGQDGRVVC